MKTTYTSIKLLLFITLLCITNIVKAQSQKKQIQIKKIIVNNDTAVKYDTSFSYDFFDEDAFNEFWDDFSDEIVTSLEPLVNPENYKEMWEKSMLYLDSLDEVVDFDFDVDFDPPSYVFYFNNGKETISKTWNFNDWDDFEEEMIENFGEMSKSIKKYIDKKDNDVEIYQQYSVNLDSKKMLKVNLDSDVIVSEYSLYNGYGIIVKQEKVEKVQCLSIDMTGKSSGFYYLKLKTNKGIMKKEFNF
jgi:hypothetical protein